MPPPELAIIRWKPFVVNETPVASASSIDREQFDDLAAVVLARCDELGRSSDAPQQISRIFCSPAMAEAHQLIRGWMTAGGMTTRVDPAGNLFGRWEPTGCDASRRLIIGSHLDTVIDAGKYDGPLGVMLGLAVVEQLRRAEARLPWAVEVVGFSEEEGVRFHTPFLGSRALAGTFDKSLLRLTDDNGVSIGQALRDFGVDPLAASKCAAAPGEIVAYLEAHIEQGPQLELAGEPLAIVVGIAGQTRLTVTWRGPGGHAGTVPMSDRADALIAASRWALAVEEIGRGTPGLVATVGRMHLEPNAANCIPRTVTASLDARHGDDVIRNRAVAMIVERAEELARDGGLSVRIEYDHEHAAIAMDRSLTDVLDAATRAAGHHPICVASGAGHDAGVMAPVAPTAMLFMRCRGGISHSPDESVEQADVAAAIDAMCRFVTMLATR